MESKEKQEVQLSYWDYFHLVFIIGRTGLFIIGKDQISQLSTVLLWIGSILLFYKRRNVPLIFYTVFACYTIMVLAFMYKYLL